MKPFVVPTHALIEGACPDVAGDDRQPGSTMSVSGRCASASRRSANPVPRCEEATYTCSTSSSTIITNPTTSPPTVATVVSSMRWAARTRNDASVRTATGAVGTKPRWPSAHPRLQMSATDAASAGSAARNSGSPLFDIGTSSPSDQQPSSGDRRSLAQAKDAVRLARQVKRQNQLCVQCRRRASVRATAGTDVDPSGSPSPESYVRPEGYASACGLRSLLQCVSMALVARAASIVV